MCFVLDANSFNCLFDRDSKGHEDFAPLLKWLYDNPKTSLVIGGTTYRRELSRLATYLEYIVELKRNRKLSEIDDAVVDAEEVRIRSISSHADFDDQHIIALFSASGCLLFASQDKRADPFVRMISLYPKGHKRPSIYRKSSHVKLLNGTKIVPLRNKKP